ncbi:hypothetical protein SRHO_G00065980 [Serrasalmus rhombeus]
MAGWQQFLVLEEKAIQVGLALLLDQNDNLTVLTMALLRCFRQVPVALTVRMRAFLVWTSLWWLGPAHLRKEMLGLETGQVKLVVPASSGAYAETQGSLAVLPSGSGQAKQAASELVGGSSGVGHAVESTIAFCG